MRLSALGCGADSGNIGQATGRTDKHGFRQTDSSQELGGWSGLTGK